MIDAGRKYIPMNYLRQLVKVMAYYKMNTLQVHLNDNGFKQYFGNDWAKHQQPSVWRVTISQSSPPKMDTTPKRSSLTSNAKPQH